MPSLKQKMTQQQQADAIADLYGKYIDQPNDPNSKGSLQDPAFFRQFQQLAPPSYSSADIGVLQQNPQYRGIRMVLPQSGGSYGQLAPAEGLGLPGRVETQGPIGQPDPLDPHRNQIPLVPPNYPADRGGLQQMILGRLITRGYPVLGGNGPMGGDFQPNFNPIGFGQR